MELSYPVNRLVEACEPVLLLINQIRVESDNLGDMDSLRKRIVNHLEAMEKRARELGVSGQEIHLAKYALVVFMDEIILATSWQDRDLWEEEPLQLELFGKNTGGEDFFTEIDNIQKQDYKATDLTELYYLCIVLGFEGDYVDDQMELMKKKNQLLDSLMNNPGNEKELSPSWRRNEMTVVKKKWKQWMVPALSVLVVVILYVMYFYLIDNYTEGIIKEFNKLGIK